MCTRFPLNRACAICSSSSIYISTFFITIFHLYFSPTIFNVVRALHVIYLENSSDLIRKKYNNARFSHQLFIIHPILKNGILKRASTVLNKICHRSFISDSKVSFFLFLLRRLNSEKSDKIQSVRMLKRALDHSRLIICRLCQSLAFKTRAYESMKRMNGCIHVIFLNTTFDGRL